MGRRHILERRAASGGASFFLTSASPGCQKVHEKPKSQNCEFSRLNSKMAKKTPETDFGVEKPERRREIM